MKKYLSLAVALLLCLCGCTTTDEPEDGQVPDENTTNPEIVEPQEFQLDGNAGLVLESLNTYLESQGLTDDYERFRDGYTCEVFDSLTLYRCTAGMGYNRIVAQRKDTGAFHLVDLGDYVMYNITSANVMRHDPDILCFTMECKLFGGDYYFINFPATVYYSLEAGQVIEAVYDYEDGTYGVYSGRDYQVIESLDISPDQAVFTMAWTEGGDGNGYSGADLVVEMPRRYEYQNPTAIGFRYTQNSLDDAVLRQLREITGVADAWAEYIDNALFTGTMLTVTPEPWFQVVLDLDSGNMERMTLRCRQIEFPVPDFTRELGYSLELPEGIELREPADVYDGRHMKMLLATTDGTELELNISASPVDSLSDMDYIPAEELEVSERDIGGYPVWVISSKGAEWPAQWEAHWYEGEHHISLITWEELSQEDWSSLVGAFIQSFALNVAQ